MIQILCETAESGKFSVNLTSVFTFIGMAFSIIVSLVALVWLTCFVVRMLVKTFKSQIQNSYDVFVENNTAKAQSKKERNAIKRKAKDARKLELLNLKEESKDRIHRMKVDKLSGSLIRAENRAEEKYATKKDAIVEKSNISKEIKKHQEFEDFEKKNAEKTDIKETHQDEEIKDESKAEDVKAESKTTKEKDLNEKNDKE